MAAMEDIEDESDNGSVLNSAENYKEMDNSSGPRPKPKGKTVSFILDIPKAKYTDDDATTDDGYVTDSRANSNSVCSPLSSSLSSLVTSDIDSNGLPSPQQISPDVIVNGPIIIKNKLICKQKPNLVVRRRQRHSEKDVPDNYIQDILRKLTVIEEEGSKECDNISPRKGFVENETKVNVVEDVPCEKDYEIAFKELAIFPEDSAHVTRPTADQYRFFSETPVACVQTNHGNNVPRRHADTPSIISPMFPDMAAVAHRRTMSHNIGTRIGSNINGYTCTDNKFSGTPRSCQSGNNFTGSVPQIRRFSSSTTINSCHGVSPNRPQFAKSKDIYNLFRSDSVSQLARPISHRHSFHGTPNWTSQLNVNAAQSNDVSSITRTNTKLKSPQQSATNFSQMSSNRRAASSPCSPMSHFPQNSCASDMFSGFYGNGAIPPNRSVQDNRMHQPYRTVQIEEGSGLKLSTLV